MPRVCPQCHEQYDASIEHCPVDGTRLDAAAHLTPAATIMMAIEMDPLIGQLLADRYRIKRTLGEGGMGRVYLAEHERMGRLSAVKVMSAQIASSPDAISRFNREAANASRIHQPNVAAIYDFGETSDGTLYLAMEYVQGETLTSLLKREGPLTPQRAAELTGQIADGLHAAHHLGIVHRDLKPDNILVTKLDDTREWAKIVDFGIAKQATQSDQSITSLGMAVGTPEYMSPEQLSGDTLDGRTDLYSLGLVLFGMLTGQLPHPAMTSKQSLVQRLTSRPRTLAEVAPRSAWSPRLQKALDRALAPEPDDRYRSVIDFARDVRASVGIATLNVGAATMVGGASARPVPIASADASRAAPLPQVQEHRRGRGVLIAAVLLVVAGGSVAAVGRDRVVSALGTVGGAHGARHVVAPPVPSDSAGTDSTQVEHLAQVTRPDSVRPPMTALSPMDPGQKLESAALQDKRRANGDSTDAGPRSTLMQTAEDETREIMSHVNRAQQMARTDKLQGAGLELRTAYEEYRIFLTEHATSPQVERLRSELQSAMDETIEACGVARDAEVTKGGRVFRCDNPVKTGVLMVYDAPAAPR